MLDELVYGFDIRLAAHLHSVWIQDDNGGSLGRMRRWLLLLGGPSGPGRKRPTVRMSGSLTTQHRLLVRITRRIPLLKDVLLPRKDVTVADVHSLPVGINEQKA